MAPTAQRNENAGSSSSAAPATTQTTPPSISSLYGAGRPPPLLIKGNSIPDGKSAVHLVQDYALYHNKQVRVDANRGGKHRKVICSSAGCPFFVQFYQRHSKNGDRSWYLSSMDTSHSETCTSTARPTRRQLTEMASFKDALANTPGASASSLATYVGSQSNVPLNLNLRTVYRAKQALRNSIFDAQAQSFRRLPALLSQFLSINAGSYASHDVDEDGCFVRAIIASGVFCEATTHNQQVFGFECVPIDGTFPGAHLYLLGKDGNRKTLIIAAAVISTQTHGEPLSFDHLSWFFRSVHAAGVDIQACPIISALSPTLLEVEAELGLQFRLCTRHFIAVELDTIPSFSTHHHALIWGLQASETAIEFNNRLKWIATTCGPEVAARLRHLPVERWAIAGNEPTPPLYGWRSRDFSDGTDRSEKFNSLTERLKTKLPVDFLDSLMESWVQAAFERSSSYETWAHSGLAITPGAQELYDREVQRISDFMVTRSSSSIAFVSPVQSDPMSSAANAGRCRVDLNANTCTCMFMQQHGIPCRHVIAVVLFCGLMDSIHSRFADCYRISIFGDAYHDKVVELPLQAGLTETDECRPPRRSVRRTRDTATVSLLDQVPDHGDSDLPMPFDGLLSPTAEPSESVDTPAGRNPRKRPRQAAAATGDQTTATSNSIIGNVTQPQPRTVRCGRCKRAGHNARSCTTNS